MSVIATVIASLVVGDIICAAVGWLLDLWGNRVIAPSSLCTSPMSETDQKMQRETIGVLQDVFGENINETIQQLKAAERINKAEELVERLKTIYGVDVKVDFYGENRANCGYYNQTDNSLNLNVADLLSKNSENVYEFLDTIIHELRHAVQWKAVQEEGFWNVDEQTRAAWIHNFAHYISVNADPRGYARQPVEMDARTFAAGCIKGVMDND